MKDLKFVGEYRLYKIYEIDAENPEVDFNDNGRYIRNSILIFSPHSYKFNIGDEWKSCHNYEVAKKIIDLDILKNNFYNTPLMLFLNEEYLYNLTLEEKRALEEMYIDIEFKNRNINNLSDFYKLDIFNKNKLYEIVNFYKNKGFKQLKILNIKKLEELSKNLKLRKFNSDKFLMYKKQQELNRIG